MYSLLTGSTGLLGRYLLRDMLLAGMPVCVLVRGNRRESPADRVETIVRRWERLLGRSLPRPVVLNGHLGDPQLGLSSEDIAWVRANCTRVVHAAASLKFQVDADGEPQRTNIDGTKNLLAFSQTVGLGELHYVSSAYVAGLRKDCVSATDLNVSESWSNNPYLGSKAVAEELVRECTFFNSITIYRPSMIVGDSDSGYTSTYHGFYTPLRVGHALAPRLALTDFNELNFLDLFELTGDECKNLVPVDWVSAAMVAIIRMPEAHGASYHLTHPRPITVNLMQQLFLETLLPLLARDVRESQPQGWAEARDALREQMRIYQAYWRNDATFDRTGTDRVLPHLPCPEMDEPRVRQLARFAVEKNFGWPSDPCVPCDWKPANSYDDFARDSQPSAAPAAERICLNVQLTGPGGGDWHFFAANGTLLPGGRGLSTAADLTFYATSQTFAAIAQQTLDPRAALTQGSVLALGSHCPLDQTAALLESLAAVFNPQQELASSAT